MPLVSVILPTYCRPELTLRAVRSVLAQTVEDWELIVVDDGSPEEKLPQLPQDPRVQFVRHSTNQGASSARNTGIAQARGRFIAFIDSDVEWLPQKLERQLPLFRLSSVGVVCCGFEWYTASQRRIHIPNARGFVFSKVLRRQVAVWDTNTLVVKAEAEPQFDPLMPAYEDYDLLVQLTAKWELDFVPEALVRVQGDTAGPRASDHNLEGRLRILEKYKPLLEQDPLANAYHHIRVAITYYHRRQMALCRRYLWRAAVACPSFWRIWPWLAGSAGGPRTLRWALAVFRHPITR